LPKNVDDVILVRAIQVTLLGGVYYPEEYSVRIRDFISAGEIPAFELSKNEVEIIRLLASGKSSKQIAAILKYTVGSIDTKRYRLEKKMFAKSTAELVAKAINLGIVRFSSGTDSLDQ
jgi:DNA-binding NarL/FixJ family response regulator